MTMTRIDDVTNQCAVGTFL